MPVDRLPPGAVARLGDLRFRHGNRVTALAFSSRGSTLATTGDDRLVRLWDTTTGTLLGTFEGHTNPVRAVVFAPGDKALITAAWDNTLRFWDLSSGRLIKVLKDPPSSASALAVSPDSTQIASGGVDKMVRIWNLATGDVVFRMPGHSDTIGHLAYSTDGKRLYSSGQDRMIRIWSTETGKQLRAINLDPKSQFPATRVPLAVSPQGKGVAMGMGRNPLLIMDEDIRVVRAVMPSTGGAGAAVAWAPSGKVLASAGSDGHIHLWNSDTGAKLRTCEEPSHSVAALGFSPDSRILASAEGCTVRLWNVEDGKPIDRRPGHQAQITSVGFDSTSKLVATGSLDGDVLLWVPDTGKLLHRLSGHKLGAQVLAFSPCDRLLATGCRDENIRLWNPDTGAHLRNLSQSGTTRNAYSLAFGPDGRVLASAGGDGFLVLWDPHRGKELRRVAPDIRGIPGLAWMPDGKSIVRTSRTNILLWPLDRDREPQEFGRSRPLDRSIALTTDGKLLAVISREGILLFETAMRRKLRELKMAPDHFLAVAFSPDGRWLASGGTSRLVRIWDVASGKERHRLEGHFGPVHALAFSRDGQHLVSGSDDGTAVVWSLPALEKGVLDAPTVLARDEETLWNDLASLDAVQAFRVMNRMCDIPTRVTAIFQARLQPARLDSRHTQLIANLTDDDGGLRIQAQAEVARLGAQVEVAMRQALSARPASAVKQMLESYLERLEEPVRDPERLRRLRALEILERIDTREGKFLLENLARGAPEAELTREARACLRRLEKKSAR